jgi:hypothetical protein
MATAEEAGVPNEAAAYLASLEDTEVIERVRCTVCDAHVFAATQADRWWMERRRLGPGSSARDPKVVERET